jgi:ABC-type glycerol-3-phosphate transport system substrate-binding protein
VAPSPVALATWWLSGSEQTAVAASAQLYKSTENRDVNVVAITQNGNARLDQFRSLQWDLGQANAPDVPTTMCVLDPATVDQPNVDPSCLKDGSGNTVGYIIQDLLQIPDLSSTLATIPGELVPSLMVDGKMLTFPNNINRENTLHYNLAVTNPPATAADLTTFCDNYVACIGNDPGSCGNYPYGTTGNRPPPLGISGASWITRILFESLLPGNVASHTETDSATVLAAFASALGVISDFYTRGCLWLGPINNAGDENDWTAPAKAVLAGQTLMYIHGDWAKGEMIFAGAVPGTDFGVSVAPGSGGNFLYGTDVFGISNTADLASAIDYVKFELSPAAQIAFSEKKGSTPAVTIDDPTVTIQNPVLRQAYSDLQSARAAGKFLQVPAFASGMGDFANLVIPTNVVYPGTLQSHVVLPASMAQYAGRSPTCVAHLYKCAYDNASLSEDQCANQVLPTEPTCQ